MTGSIGALAPVIPAPHIQYGQLSPMLLVFGAAVAGVLVEAFAPRPLRRTLHLAITLGGLAAAFVLTIFVAQSSTFSGGSPGRLTAYLSVAVDQPTLFIQGTILVLAFVSVLLIAESSHDVSAFAAQAAAVPGSAEEREGLLAGISHTEVYPLTLFAVGGMLLFPASNDLLTMFVALEVLSLPLYLLCGLARRRRLLSQEAAMKYFLLGAFSSAFFLFGVAMLYGFSGSVRLSKIATAASGSTSSSVLLYAGIALIGVGLLFKIGAVPFQAWKPDVYQGAPTPVTALMASCTLVSAFGALLRVFYVAFGQLTWDWRPMIYLAAYGVAVVGAFAVVTLIRDASGEAGHLSRWAGLGRRSPLVAGIFAFFLIAFAGIPLTSGFNGKFAVFQAAIAGGALPLVVVGVLSSAILAFPYARVIVLMFFSEPVADGPAVVRPSAFTSLAVGIGVLATLVLGLAPEPLLRLAHDAATQLFVR